MKRLSDGSSSVDELWHQTLKKGPSLRSRYCLTIAISGRNGGFKSMLSCKWYHTMGFTALGVIKCEERKSPGFQTPIVPPVDSTTSLTSSRSSGMADIMSFARVSRIKR
jgi:hypothetical protein